MKEINWMLVIGALIVGIAMGMAIGGAIMSSEDFKYQDASIMTCEYANRLANATNQCTATLELYSGSHYEVMNMLDCQKLKGGK